jgi:hypothetical protein
LSLEQLLDFPGKAHPENTVKINISSSLTIQIKSDLNYPKPLKPQHTTHRQDIINLTKKDVTNRPSLQDKVTIENFQHSHSPSVYSPK